MSMGNGYLFTHVKCFHVYYQSYAARYQIHQVPKSAVKQYELQSGIFYALRPLKQLCKYFLGFRIFSDEAL